MSYLLLLSKHHHHQGAEDVRVVPMKYPFLNITHLVIASGRSTRHVAKMSLSIVQAVRVHYL
jgi:ribosomal silencing factor RsfS